MSSYPESTPAAEAPAGAPSSGPAPGATATGSPAAQTEKAKPTLGVEEIGIEPRRTHTAENVDGLPGLSIIQSRSSFIDFPPGIFPAAEISGTGAGAHLARLRTTATVATVPEDKVGESDPDSPVSPAEGALPAEDAAAIAAAEAAEWEIYNRFPRIRKIFMSVLMSYCGMLSSISSTAVLAALPEVSADYGVEGSTISLSNAICLIFMGLGPCLWGPSSQNWGRRLVVLAIGVVYTLGSLGTALSPNLGSFFFFRILTSFAGLSFQVIGSAIIGDIYHPTERATGMGWYLIGPLIGPSIAPFMGSVIITLAPWRAIFWVQTVMGGIALILIFFFLPETLMSYPRRRIGWWLLATPIGMVKLFRYPNLICVGVTAGALVWNSYSLLTPIRYVLNPRFNLTSPLQSGLFFLAPGVGNAIGAFFGTRYADMTVRRWIKKRGGHTRVPEDRLRAGLFAMGVFLPACVLIYGWTVEKAVGGIPVPAIFMVLQGAGSMMVFPTIDTYCMDVYQSRAAETLGGNFMVKFWFGAVGSAAVIPTVEAIGVGGFSTISAGLMVLGAGTAYMAARWGPKWRAATDAKVAASAQAKAEKAAKKAAEKEKAGEKEKKKTDKEEEAGGVVSDKALEL